MVLTDEYYLWAKENTIIKIVSLDNYYGYVRYRSILEDIDREVSFSRCESYLSSKDWIKYSKEQAINFKTHFDML